jgi:serine/threonine-protein kinase HipA
MKKYYLFLYEDYIGDLFIDEIHGEEVFSFSFSNSYLLDNKKIIIDPELFPYSGRQYSKNNVFGFINDMTPDRFGKLLLDKQEIERATSENRSPMKLKLSDYLTRVSDISRMGALRIKENIDGDFISNEKKSIPPYIYIRDIEQASIELEKNNNDVNALKKLLYPGSSLGGARPKANVYYNDNVYIAKFPSKNDDYDIELLEYLLLQTAKKCGMNVPEIKIEKYSNFGHTLLIKRFDRDGDKRIHYMSAVTALNTSDGESSNYSYIDLVSFIVTNCHNINENLKELYRRMVFSYLINNTDNHLRNHAFLLNENQYELSPLFDINPSIYVSNFALPLVVGGESKDAIIAASLYFKISEKEAKEIYESMYEIVLNDLKKMQKEYKELDKVLDIIIKIANERG